MRWRPAASARGRRRLLVIEDDPDVGEALRTALEVGGHEVEIAANGYEGIAKAHRFEPDVVLCDIGLPGMDGYAVARAFRADAALRATCLIALSGYAQTVGRELGARRRLRRAPGEADQHREGEPDRRRAAAAQPRLRRGATNAAAPAGRRRSPRRTRSRAEKNHGSGSSGSSSPRRIARRLVA